MSVHQYPRRALLLDYGRSILGLGFTALPVFAVPTAPVVFWILSAMATLFALYFARTALRHRFQLELTEDGIGESLLRDKVIAWDAVTELKVRYFATRRDQSDGWMQVTVKSEAKSVSFDSDIFDYDNVLATIWQAVGHRDIAMNDTTVSNLSSLGFRRPRSTDDQRIAEYSE